MPKNIARKVTGLKKSINRVLKQTPKTGLKVNMSQTGGGWLDAGKGGGFRKKS